MKKANIKTIGLFGLGLYIYGYLSESIPIYFFWESKIIGLNIILISLIGLLLNWIKQRKKVAKKAIWHKIGIGFICFYLVVQVLFILLVPYSDAYKISKEHLYEDENIIKDLGEIKSVSFIPSGEIHSEEDLGYSSLKFLVKGRKSYAKVQVYSYRAGSDLPWSIVGMKY